MLAHAPPAPRLPHPPQGSPEREWCLSEEARDHGLKVRFTSNAGGQLRALSEREFGVGASPTQIRVLRTSHSGHHRDWEGYDLVRLALTPSLLGRAFGVGKGGIAGLVGGAGAKGFGGKALEWQYLGTAAEAASSGKVPVGV